MSVSYFDVIRLEGTETGVANVIRAKQNGYASDTKRIVHKWQDGRTAIG